MVTKVDQNVPLEIDESGRNANNGHLYDDDGKPRRTGTVLSAATHIITATIGSGVLSLSWSMAQLGWIAGVGTLLTFAVITFYTSSLLADCYRSPTPRAEKRNYTYMDAVNSYLGRTMHSICGVIQYACLVGLGISYTITTSISLVAIRKSRCIHKASCRFSNNPYMIAMGIAEIFLSQIPNFDKLSFLSTIAAIMSFGYSSIGTALSLAKVVSGKGERTTLTGMEVGPDFSASEKLWSMLRAMGDMAFACNYSVILIEIQDTLRSSPPENKVMKKANRMAMLTTTSFYMLCGCMGYAAFGTHAPGNLLSSFGDFAPYWLVDMANVFVVVHLVGAYQLLTQPVFKAFESWVIEKWPTSKLVTSEYHLGIGHKFCFNISFLRLTFRTIYVVAVTTIAMALPFFNSILALLGAIGYWPLTVYFPVAMHIAQNKIKRGTIKWCGLQILCLVCMIVTLAAACGAIEGLSRGLQASKPFQFKE